MKRFVIGLALLTVCSGTNAKIVQYLYIEANEGTASGGHVALQIDDDVFHYQYHDGLIRLNRDNSDNFRFDYRYLQNRPLHVADIEIPNDKLTLLQEDLTRAFWDQAREFKRLQSLENDSQLLIWLISLKATPPKVEPHNLQLPGAGLFFSSEDFSNKNAKSGECETQSATQKIMSAVRSQVQQRYGADFLTRRKHALTRSIRELDVPSASFADTRNSYRFSERYLDLVNTLLALQVIENSHALSKHACHTLPAQAWQLTAGQMDILQTYQKHLLDSVLVLINSKRPDWGQAVFVTLARIVVLQQSLDSGLWVFLDDFKVDADTITTNTYDNQADALNQQRDLARQRWVQEWNAISQAGDFNDNRYTDLELSANRYLEWQTSLSTKSLRIQGQQPLPLQPLKLPITELPDLNIQALQERLRATQKAISTLNAELQTHYGYDLITRNCVTELSRNLELALTHDPVESRLFSPVSQFVPFMNFANLPSAFPVKRVWSLPSFRQQQLSQLYANEFTPWVYLRESNVLSAELYRYNPDDALFVFFTDDGLLFRPLFGAFNTVTSLAQSILGLFEWPFDAGERLRNGTRGLMMSLPELAFINIRKGSYKFVAPRYFTSQIQSP